MSNTASSSAKPPPYRRYSLLALALMFLVVFILYLNRPDPVITQITTVHMGSVEQTIASTRAGTVKACRRAKLSPSTGGQIALLPIKEGDQVKAGTLLLSLENQDLVAQVDLAKQEIQSARRAAQATCHQAEFSQRETQRLRQLREEDAVSEERFDSVKTQSMTDKANCQAAGFTIKIRQAQLDVAEALVAKTRLIAPFDGVIADISAELSEYVTPSPVGVQTTPVVDLIDNQCFYVAAPIDEVDVPAINNIMPVRISLDAFREQFFEGRVRRISAYVLDREKQARTVDIEVDFANPADYRQLLAGYSADIEIITASKSDTLRIPTESLFETNKVWLYDQDAQTIKAQTISLGLSNWHFTEVLEGLKKGDTIVLNANAEGLAEGVTVKPIKGD